MRKYTTIEGDTFDLLALDFYNDEKAASAIIEVNPDHCDVMIFESGVALSIPDEPSVILPETLPPWRREV